MLFRSRILMIEVTRLNGGVLTVNHYLIETVEETPDTVITLTTGKKLIVKESRPEIHERVKSYEKEVFSSFADISTKNSKKM